MSEKRIILAHGLNGEVGVPTSVRKSGLPWPRLEGDSHFFRLQTAGSPLIMGRKTYDIASRYLFGEGRVLYCVTSHPEGMPNACASLEEAIARAEAECKPDRPIYIGGGAQLARRAFEFLENEGAGAFYETVVEGEYPSADAYMPEYRQEMWSEPEVLYEHAAAYTTRTTAKGLVLPVPLPAYHIQVRHIIQS